MPYDSDERRVRERHARCSQSDRFIRWQQIQKSNTRLCTSHYGIILKSYRGLKVAFSLDETARVARCVRRRVLEHTIKNNGGYLSQACSAAAAAPCTSLRGYPSGMICFATPLARRRVLPNTTSPSLHHDGDYFLRTPLYNFSA
jgi:hypothetical protein